MAKRTLGITTVCDQCGKTGLEKGMFLGLILRDRAGEPRYSLDYCSEACRLAWKDEHPE